MLVKWCVEMLSDKTIEAIKNEWAGRLPQESLTGNLATTLQNHDNLHQLWTKLNPIEQEAITVFLLKSAKGFIRKKDWELHVQQKNPQLLFGLNGLRRLGLVFTVRKIWSEIGYLMPREVRLAFAHAKCLVEQVSHQDDLPHREVLSYYIPAGRGIHLDLFGCLLYIRDNQVKVTQKRTVPKRTLQKLFAASSLWTDHIVGWYERSFPSEIQKAYTPQEAFLLDLLLRLRLCKWEGKEIMLSQPDVMSFLAMDSSTRSLWLLQTILHAYTPLEPWVEAGIELIMRTQHHSWQPIERLLRQVGQQGYELPSEPELHNATKKYILHPLLGLGILEVGEKSSQLFWRKHPAYTDSQRIEDFWYVEPTGVLLINPQVSLARLWELSRIGVLDFTGDMIRCILHPKKVQAFISNGGTEDELIHLVQQGCPYPVPESVSAEIQSWARATKQIHFTHVIRVTTAHPSLLQELQGIQMIAPYLTEIISDTDFLIASTQQDELLQLLQQCGFEPSQGKLEKTGMISNDKVDLQLDATAIDQWAGLFSLAVPWDGYKVENVLPDPATENRLITSLPKIWTQHAQSYHPQTSRDILKRAEELKLMVYIQVSSGEELEGIPERMEVEMGYWMITLEVGKRKQKIRLEDISRLKLIIPDYI